MVPLFSVSTVLSVLNDATSGKDSYLLGAVFSGMVMCVIVYKLTGFVSTLSFKGYGKLNEAQKVEWNNRGFSTFHAVVSAGASLYLLLFSGLFDDDNQGVLVVHRNSKFSNSVLGVSLGYFLTDLAMILWNFPSLGGLEYVLHHGLSMFSILLAVTSGHAQIYILMVLFSEITTPFVNLRWYLDVAGQKSSKLYIYNGVLLFLGWLAARVLLFIFFFAHMFLHFDEVKKIFPLGFYGLLSVPPMLAVMNAFWFWKILKGMLKTLSKAKHSR